MGSIELQASLEDTVRPLLIANGETKVQGLF